MKVFLAGATGVLGRRLITGLRERGHAVVGLSRRPENDVTIRALGGEPRHADLFDPDSLARAAEGAEVIMRAATAIPRGTRLRGRDWVMNDRIRREGTRALTEAAARVRAKGYVQESIVWVAAPPDGSLFDEDAVPVPRPWFRSAADAEGIARRAAEAHGFVAASVRFGTFYSADSEQTRTMGERLTRGELPIPGPGEAIWSCTHVDDAALAMLAVMDAGLPGIWHAVDDEPVTLAAFFQTFAERLRAPEPRHVPRWLAGLAVGGPTVDFLTMSTRTSAAKLRRKLGWSPRFPTVRQGLQEVAERWKAEGFPPGDR